MSTTHAARGGHGALSRTARLVRKHKGAAFAIALASVGLLVAGIVWFEPHKAFLNTTVSEGLPPDAARDARVIARGSFRGLDHDASGAASLIETGGRTYVRFEDDFRVLNGPDLVVYLSEHPATSPAGTFARDFVLLGELKGNRGSQNYEIPAGVDLSDHRSVVVWCRRFNVGFAVAPLEA